MTNSLRQLPLSRTAGEGAERSEAGEGLRGAELGQLGVDLIVAESVDAIRKATSRP